MIDGLIQATIGQGYAVLIDADGQEVSPRSRFLVGSGQELLIGPATSEAVQYRLLTHAGEPIFDRPIGRSCPPGYTIRIAKGVA